MTAVKTVDAYIAAAPPPARMMMRQIRAAIKSAAPRAEEKLSYGMPYYGYSGRLAYFAGFRDHVSLFVMGKSQTSFLAQQKKYRHGRATLRFPLGSRLPLPLIRKLIRVRVKEIDGQKKSSH